MNGINVDINTPAPLSVLALGVSGRFLGENVAVESTGFSIRNHIFNKSKSWDHPIPWTEYIAPKKRGKEIHRLQPLIV